jgi:hypothetical protein
VKWITNNVKPDYGSQLLREGVSCEVDLLFYGYAIFSIDVLGPGQYSTMADKERGGKWYAVSMDFDQRQLDRILSIAPQQVAHRVRAELARTPGSPRAIDLSEPVLIDVRARLGKPQKAAAEVFVPLVCQEILTGSNARPLILTISPADIERQSTGPLLGAIRHWAESSKRPLTLLGQLQVLFAGYGADSRELWQVPNVRQFVQSIDEEFPFWFYFADLNSEFLRVLAFCLCRSSVVGRGSTAINSQDFAAFLERHVAAMNQIMEHWKVNEAVNRRRTEEILSYFEQARILN